MERYARHKKKKSLHAMIIKEGLKDVHAFAMENVEKIDEWELAMERKKEKFDHCAASSTESPKQYRERVERKKSEQKAKKVSERSERV